MNLEESLAAIRRTPLAATEQEGMVEMRMLPLSTRRLVLRRLTEADAAAFAAYRSDPDVARYQGWDGCSHTEAEAFILDQQSFDPGEPGRWFQVAIALKEDGALLGDCALRVHSPDVR